MKEQIVSSTKAGVTKEVWYTQPHRESQVDITSEGAKYGLSQ